MRRVMRYHIMFGVGTTVLGALAHWGCNPPAGGGSGGGPGSLALSAKEAAPGEFVTLDHPSIWAGVPLEVRFSGPNDFRISATLAPVADGSVQVPVPPFIDPATGASGSAAVSVSVTGMAGARTLTIQDLPAVTELAPGEAYQVLIQKAIETYRAALDDLAAMDAELGAEVDSTEAVAAIRTEVAALESILAGLDTTGTLTVEVPGAGIVTLGEAELRLLDRIVLANITGLAAVLQIAGTPKAVGTHPLNAQTAPPKSERQLVEERVQDVVVALNQGFAAGSALLGVVSLGLSVAAFTMAAPGAAVATVAGVAVSFLAGAYSFATAAASHQMTRGARNANGTTFNAGQKAAEGLVDVGLSAAGALPGTVGRLASGASVVRTVRSTANSLQEAQCRRPESPQRLPAFDEFCSSGEDDDDASGTLCVNTCIYAGDAECDDGGAGAAYALCELGTDCADCGAREAAATTEEGLNGCWQVHFTDAAGIPTGQDMIWQIENGQLAVLWSMNGSRTVEGMRFTRSNSPAIGAGLQYVFQEITPSADGTRFTITYEFTIVVDGVNGPGSTASTVTVREVTIGVNASGQSTFSGSFRQVSHGEAYDEQGELQTYDGSGNGLAIAVETSCPDPALENVLSQEELEAELLTGGG